MIDLAIFPRAKVRLTRQTEVAECGLACLTMIANFHGLDVDLATMRRHFDPSLRGTSIRTLIEMANQIGLIPRAVRVSLDYLEELHVPAILHWNMNHFVVLERFSRGRALIHNPNGSTAWLRLEEASSCFTGVALELRPSNEFARGTHRQTLRLSQLWGRMTGLKRTLAQTFVLSMVIQGLLLASPYYMQIAVDSALPALDNNLLAVLAIGFGLLAIINSTAVLLRSFVLLHAGTNVSFGLSTNVARHLFRLPIAWFEKRHSGDILSRLQSVSPIQKLLTEDAISALVDGALGAFTLGIMFFYSASLALVAVGAFALQCVVRAITFDYQREAQESRIVAAGREQTTQIETLRGITTVRLFNREALRHALWQTRLIEVTNADARLARISIWKNTLSSIISGLENVITIWLAITFVISGAGFSLGMVFAYMAYKTQFTKKAETLIDQMTNARMLRLHLDRLSDVVLTPEDDSFSSKSVADQSLVGQIVLRDVCYRYSESDPLVLNGVNLIIEPGDHIAITGPSGCGKSTLVKLALGLLTPTKGDIVVDGLPLANFGLRNFQRQVSAVMQDDHLFSGSLAENIAFFDERPDMDLVVSVAKTAGIHQDIERMPMQYETLVGDMGSTLSGGQRQRVLLARALYRRPRLLIMDEGTAHLDAAHEKAVNDAISEMGITRIIIAHRKETIEAASQIYLMHLGSLIRLGDHAPIAENHPRDRFSVKGTAG